MIVFLYILFSWELFYPKVTELVVFKIVNWFAVFYDLYLNTTISRAGLT